MEILVLCPPHFRLVGGGFWGIEVGNKDGWRNMSWNISLKSDLNLLGLYHGDFSDQIIS